MLSNFTLGQYFQSDSVIHKLDPRFKLTELIAFIVFLFLANNFISIGMLAAVVVIIILASKVPVKMYLRNFKVILPIILLTAILNAFYITDGTVLFKWGVISISSGGISRAAFVTLRIFLLIVVSAVLTYTTTPTELTDAIESLLSPLKFIGLREAVHVLAMMMTITLRFIPTLTEETDKIISAQKARGADMESGGIIKRVKSLIPILIPMLIISVRRAYELAEAMDCRCYSGGKGRTRMNKLKCGLIDYISVFIMGVILAGIIILNMI